MKQAIASMIAFAATLTASSADNVVISGNVPAVPDSCVVALILYEGQSASPIASDTVFNGRFCLSADIDCELPHTELILISNGRPGRRRKLYLRPGAKVEVSSPDQFVQTWTVSSNVPEQAEYDRFIDKSKDLLEMQQRIDNDFATALRKATDNEERRTLIASFEAGKNYRDSLKVVTLFNDIEILRQSPVTKVWLDKMANIADIYSFYENDAQRLSDSLKQLYAQLDEPARASMQGQRIHTLLYPPALTGRGDTVPDGIFTDIEGNRHTLAEMRGKWVLLDFWSAACHPCILSMPELHEFEEKHAGVAEVVSLSVDSEKLWREATVRHNVRGNNWNEGKNDVGLYRNFGAEGLPTFVLISPEGVVKSKWLTPGQLEREFNLYSKHKDLPQYSEENGLHIVRQPEYGDNNTGAVLDIESVDMSDKGTTLHFSVTFTPGWWISISPDSFLTTDEGTELHLTGSEGITPGEQYYTDEKGTGAFSLTFEPLAADSEYISFIEGPDSDWSIKNIRIREAATR